MGHESLFPTLHRMAGRGRIEGAWGILESGRRAPPGRAQLKVEKRDWRTDLPAVNQVLAEESRTENWTHLTRALLRGFLRRRKMEDNLDEEVRTNFEIHVERRVEKGQTRQEALRGPRLEYESLEQVKEKLWDAGMRATRGDRMKLVVGGGSMPVLAGLAAGFLGALGLAQFLQSMLFATSVMDALTLFSVSALFLSVALAASILPAWRAARVDPMSALRQE